MLVLSLTGCGGSDAPEKTSPSIIPTPQNIVETNVFTDLKAIKRSPSLASELDVEQQVLAINNYALKALNNSSSSDNLGLAPYSEQSLLSQLYFATTNETAQQMAEVFNFADKQDVFFSTLNSLDLLLTTQDSALQSNNTLWAEHSYDFSLAFLTNSKANMGSEVRDVDILKQTSTVDTDINNWLVTKLTDVNVDSFWNYTLRENDKLIALNILTFKAAWLNPIEQAFSYTADFTLQNGSRIDAEYISTNLATAYFDDGENVIVAIPTIDPRYNVYLLSSTQETFPSMIEALSINKMEQLIGAMSLSDVTINFPKFTYTSNVSLTDGLGEINDEYNAQLPLLNTTQQNDVYLLNAQQKIQLQIDEAGIELATLSSLILRQKPEPIPSNNSSSGGIFESIIFPPFVVRPIEEKIIVSFEKPFIFFVKDSVTGTLITLGRINNPNDH
jgi:serpin B